MKYFDKPPKADWIRCLLPGYTQESHEKAVYAKQNIFKSAQATGKQ